MYALIQIKIEAAKSFQKVLDIFTCKRRKRRRREYRTIIKEDVEAAPNINIEEPVEVIQKKICLDDGLAKTVDYDLPTHFGKKKKEIPKKSSSSSIPVEEDNVEMPEKQKAKLDIWNYKGDRLFLLQSGSQCILAKITTKNLVPSAGFYQSQKKRAQARSDETFSSMDNNLVDIQDDPNLKKYIKQRYFLFSLYDEGIKLDRESWYSVTPEIIAEYVAKRIKAGVVIDGFCGVGGNIIQFAKTNKVVIASDIDSNKVEMAKHNAKIYGVDSKIEFIASDFLKLSKVKADAVFVSPPWGGTDYSKDADYSIFTSVYPDIRAILRQSLSISDNVAMFLPRNIKLAELAELFDDYFEKARMVSPACFSIEIESVEINDKSKGLIVYFGKFSCIKKSEEYSFIYRLFGDTQQANNLIRPLLKEIGIRSFLKSYNEFLKAHPTDKNKAAIFTNFVQKSKEVVI
jgi:trimethylguanosine synthase